MAPSLFSSKVGHCSTNNRNDVAVLQAALKGIKNPGEQRGDGTWWPGQINGMYTPGLEKAIAAFQSAHNISGNQGCIHPGDATEQKLVQLLPAERKHLRCFAEDTQVFCFDPQGRLRAASNDELLNDPDLPEALARDVHYWLDQWAEDNKKCYTAQRRTRRSNAVEYFLKCPDVRLLDANGHVIREQGMTPAERSMLAGSTPANSGLGSVKILPGHGEMVMEIATDVVKSVGEVIDGIMNSRPFKAMMSVVSGFSGPLAGVLIEDFRGERDRIVNDVKAGRVTIRSGLKVIQTAFEALATAFEMQVAGYINQAVQLISRSYGGLKNMLLALVGDVELLKQFGNENTQAQTNVAEVVEKTARDAGLPNLARHVKGIGAKLFVISFAVSLYNVLTADNFSNALTAETSSLLVDAALGAVAAVAGIAVGSTIIVPLILGVAAALVFSDELEQIKSFVQKNIKGLFPGAYLTHARN